MERNMRFPAGELDTIKIRLAWAHLDIITDDMEDIALLAAGDDSTVSELAIRHEEGQLIVEQPQYGLSLKLNTGLWAQLCLRLPRTWLGDLDAGTLSGTLCARTVHVRRLSLETVSGSMHLQRIRSDEDIALRTVSGSIQAGALTGPHGYIRSISGHLNAQDVACPHLRASTVSGKLSLSFCEAFETLELQSISGNLEVALPSDTVCVSQRSVSGKLSLQEIALGDEGPTISAATVSGRLNILKNTETRG